jgi:integrase
MQAYSSRKNLSDSIDYIDGEVTFTGAIEKYWEPLSAHWNADTQKTYRKHYYDILAPFFVDKPLREFDSLEHFESIIHELAREKKHGRGGKPSPRYSEETLQHFRYILRRLITIAAEGEGFLNVFLGTDYSKASSVTPDETIAIAQTQLQKSFSPSQEYEIAQRLLADPLADGKWIGLLLMWVFGYRNKEACAVAWGDIKPLPEHPGLYMLILHSSNIGSTRDSHSAGTTDNMYRIWVIPP